CLVSERKDSQRGTQQLYSEQAKTLSVPSLRATRMKHHGWDTAKPRQGKSRGKGGVRNTNLLPLSHCACVHVAIFFISRLLIYTLRQKHLLHSAIASEILLYFVASIGFKPIFLLSQELA
ncbi:hypothetical protein T265_12863, partial [Opisthorchis viverrini]